MHTCTIALSLLERTRPRQHISMGLSLRPSNLDTGRKMPQSTSTSADHPIGQAPNSGDSDVGDSGGLQRRIGLRSAVLFNMLEMIGVGPFITLPLVIAAAGYRLSVWAWVLGAAIAVADGLVWAELGAAFPRAGGSYAFLREIYGPGRRGQLAQLSLCLAGRLYRAAVHRLGLHRPLRFSRRLLARPRLGAHRRAARAPLLQLRRRRGLPAGYRAPLPQPELHHAPRLGAVCRSHGRAHRRHRLRIRPRRGHRRMAHAGCAGAPAALGPIGSYLSAASPRPRCSPPTVTGATTTSAFSAARSAGPSAPSLAPSCSRCSSSPRFIL